MGFAALGYLSPVQGAIVQEAIGVAVILNALRPLADRPGRQFPTERAISVAPPTEPQQLVYKGSATLNGCDAHAA